MNALSWWRSWHGAPMDHKWAVIAARAGVIPGIVSAVAWAVIDYASQQENRGSVIGFDAEEYAVFSGFGVEQVEKVLAAMEAKGIISNGRLTNWEKRQPKREDTTVNERVARHRELKRSVTQCNAPDKDTERDKDTDTDKEGEAPPPNFPDDEWVKDEPFEQIRLAFVNSGIQASTADDSKAITSMVNDGVTAADVLAGIAWKAAHNDGKPVSYVSQVTNPARVAMRLRLQKNNGHGVKMRILTDANGNQLQVPE